MSNVAQRAPSRISAKASRLAAISLGLTVLGVVLIPVLTFPLGSKDYTAFSLPPWGPAASIALTGVVFAAAIALAGLSQAGARRVVYGALPLAIVGAGVWLLLLWGAWWSRGFGQVFEPTSLYSQELVDSPSTIERPLPFGTEVVLRDLETRHPVFIVTVEEPKIVTQEAIDHGLPEPDDDYVAIPLRIEVVDPAAAGRGVTLPQRKWITPLSAGAAFLEGLDERTIPGYPSAGTLDLSKPGTYLVYDLIDTSKFSSGEGAYQWSLLGPGSSGAYFR